MLPRHLRRTIALALNDAGQAVGYAVPDNGPTTAFLWQEGRLWDLNDLVMLPDDHIGRAVDVNELGQMAATGPVMLTPIDRPLTDLNIDCRTDARDLIILLEQWGDTGSPADFDGDGVVGLGDLLLLLTHWG